MIRLIILPVLFLIGACAQFPEVDAATDNRISDLEYPALVPLDQIPQAGQPRLDENSADSLEAKTARLERRADALRKRPIE